MIVSATPDTAVCPVRMLLKLRDFTGGLEERCVFRGFNGRLVLKIPERALPGPGRISYDNFLWFMSHWFIGVMGISVDLSRKQFAAQSGQSGCASAATNAGVPAELWGMHGDRKFMEA